MIRVFLGFFLVFGAVGGMDTMPEATMLEFTAQMFCAVLGLALMYFGTKKYIQ
jgi:choline-glycine betaine transporter